MLALITQLLQQKPQDIKQPGDCCGNRGEKKGAQVILTDAQTMLELQNCDLISFKVLI